MSLENLIESWPGQAVVTHYDTPTGTWMFIAIHDTTLGAAMGGVRLNRYPTAADGLRDAQRLAEGMTYKWAAIGFELGGGKSVLAVSHSVSGAERDGLFERFGELVETLRGGYACGPDLGTTPRDMSVIARRTAHVHGVDGDGATIDPGPFTALGVVMGIRAALERVFGSPSPAGRTVLIQGVGDVGGPLARQLKEIGAKLLLSDLDDARARALAKELDAEVVSSDAVVETPCDVYAPCAVGATVNARSIPRLACRIVAGSANNQLGEPADADRLHERGILYAPDYVINAGGATALPLLGAHAASADAIRERIRGFELVLGEIFSEAAEHGESPEKAAQRRVMRVLDARRHRGTEARAS
jgi:leucine dehydrogenase